MSDYNDSMIEAAQEQLMRRRNQEAVMGELNKFRTNRDEQTVTMAFDDYTRLRAIEKAAREVNAHAHDGYITQPLFDALAKLRLALDGKGE